MMVQVPYSESSHPPIEDILSDIQDFDSILEGMEPPHLLFHFGIKPEGPPLT